LPQARSGDRRRIEAFERLGRADGELLLDDAFDIGKRNRLDIVLQACEWLEPGYREHVRAGRQQLAQLDERGPAFLEVGREGDGFWRRLMRVRPCEQLIVMPGMLRQIRAPDT
jgi:hypothetical protein